MVTVYHRCSLRAPGRGNEDIVCTNVYLPPYVMRSMKTGSELLSTTFSHKSGRRKYQRPGGRLVRQGLDRSLHRGSTINCLSVTATHLNKGSYISSATICSCASCYVVLLALIIYASSFQGRALADADKRDGFESQAQESQRAARLANT